MRNPVGLNCRSTNWAFRPDHPYQVHDLLGGARYLWEGRRNYVQLNPDLVPAHILLLRRASKNGAAIRVFLWCRCTPCARKLHANPLWYKDAIIYQLHIRAFCDANEDGIGDFRGLTSKLDYLQDLGVNAIWLLPFYPSPWKDDGYDIADYQGVHPSYGTLHDFRAFLREAHERGLRVITELVLNHTSDEHPWFRRARKSPPGSRWRRLLRLEPVARPLQGRADHLQGLRALELDLGPRRRGLLLAPFLPPPARSQFRQSRGPPGNLPGDGLLVRNGRGRNAAGRRALSRRARGNQLREPSRRRTTFCKALRAHVDERFQGRMLLAEANQWPEDAASYFGNGDECHAAFHFPLMPRMFIAVQMEDRFPIVDTLAQTPAIPDALSMDALSPQPRRVDPGNGHGGRARLHVPGLCPRSPRTVNLGIRRRLAPLMGNNRRKIELLNALLLSLPGTPIIYYGDELGMGDNIYLGDRNGVRTPMQWSANRNAGFSNAGPQQLYLPVVVDYEYHYETLNVETQQNNPNSLLAWMKRLIALRQQSPALEHGVLEMLQPNNPKVLAFVRRAGEDRVLVVANLSRFPQYVELDLAALEGYVPVELFGQGEFPRIGTSPLFADAGVARLFLVRPASTSRAPCTHRRRAGQRGARPGSGQGVPSARAGRPRQLGRGFHGDREPGAGEALAGFPSRPPLVRRKGQNDPGCQHLGRGSSALRGDARSKSVWSCCGSNTPTGSPKDTWFRWPSAMKHSFARRNRRAPRR